MRGVTQGASPQRAVTEEQRRSRAKDPPLWSLFCPFDLSPVRLNLVLTPLRVFMRWLLVIEREELPAIFRFHSRYPLSQALDRDGAVLKAALWKYRHIQTGKSFDAATDNFPFECIQFFQRHCCY